MSEENKRPESPEQDEQARVTEEPAAEAAEQPGEEAAKFSVEDLQLQLEDARCKADEHWNELLRARAELENSRRRAERDVENAHKFALEKFVGELLPVKDSLEMGLSASGDEENVAKIREGVDLTLKMFGGVLEKFGVQELDPTGKPFNPELHQAMTMQETADAEPNTVVAVLQKGYLLNDRLVRPAMVMVSKAPTTKPDTSDESDKKA